MVFLTNTGWEPCWEESTLQECFGRRNEKLRPNLAQAAKAMGTAVARLFRGGERLVF